MIPGLLHNRLLGGGGGGAILADPAYSNVLAYHNDTTSASATAGFDIKTDGTYQNDGTGYIDQSGNYYLPTTGAIGSGFDVRVTATLLSGTAGVVTNAASSYVQVSSNRRFQIVLSRFTAGTSVANYSILVEFRPTGGGAVVSSDTFTMTVTAEVGGGGGGGCPSIEMYLANGFKAGDVQAGKYIDGVKDCQNPVIEAMKIIGFEIGMQPGYLVACNDGFEYEGSETTPFDLRDGTSCLAPQMLGKEVLCEIAGQGLVWRTVVACYPIGMIMCARIHLGGHSFLCGKNPLLRIVSHNPSKE